MEHMQSKPEAVDHLGDRSRTMAVMRWKSLAAAATVGVATGSAGGVTGGRRSRPSNLVAAVVKAARAQKKAQEEAARAIVDSATTAGLGSAVGAIAADQPSLFTRLCGACRQLLLFLFLVLGCGSVLLFASSDELLVPALLMAVGAVLAGALFAASVTFGQFYPSRGAMLMAVASATARLVGWKSERKWQVKNVFKTASDVMLAKVKLGGSWRRWSARHAKREQRAKDKEEAGMRLYVSDLKDAEEKEKQLDDMGSWMRMTVRDPTTWTILQQYGPSHLGLWYNVLPQHQMALITSGCVPGRTRSSRTSTGRWTRAMRCSARWSRRSRR